MFKKIVLLLIPQVINKFEQEGGDDISVIWPAEIKKQLITEKYSIQEIVNLDKIEIEKIDNILKSKEKDNILIFLNYPRNKEQLNKVNILLNEKYNKDTFDYLIFAHVEEHELIKKIQTNFFTCPNCEKLHEKNTEKQEEEIYFVCKENNNLKFKKTVVEEFGDKILGQYLTENKEIIEDYINKKKGDTSSIIKIELNDEENINNQNEKIINRIKRII